MANPNDSVRAAALRSLNYFRADRAGALPEVMAALHDENAAIRADALRAIGRFGEKALPAMSEILRGLKDEDRNVCIAAATVKFTALWALREFGSAARPAVPVLIEMVERREPDAEWAAFALASIGPDARAAVPALRKALRERMYLDSPTLRAYAAHALGRMGPASDETVAALIDTFNECLRLWEGYSAERRDVGSHSVWALVEIEAGADVTGPILLRAIKAPDASIRIAGALGLGRTRPVAPDAVPALIEALDDRNRYVRRAAALALGQIGPDAHAAIPALTDVLMDKKPPVRKSEFHAGFLGEDASGFWRTSARGAAAEAIRKIDPTAEVEP
jgi:HEAT repeat protein